MSKKLNESALHSELSRSAFFKPQTSSSTSQLVAEAGSQLKDRPGDQTSGRQPRTALRQQASEEVVQPPGRYVEPVAIDRNHRVVEEHAYDIFQDQARWLNRMKLDLEEQYDKRVTGNAIVQVALDKLRLDYEKRGEQSDLIQVTVTGNALAREKGGRN